MSTSEELNSSMDNFSSQDSVNDEFSSNDSDAEIINYSIESEDDLQSKKISHINAILRTHNDQQIYNAFYCGYNEDTRHLKQEVPRPIMLKAYFNSEKTLDEMLDAFDNDRATGKVLYHWKRSSPESEIIKISFIKVHGVGCQHFASNCELQCQRCQKFVGCSYCHEQNDDLTEHDFLSSGLLKCLNCGTEQPTSSQTCQECQILLYSCICTKCGYSSINTKFFHCNKCGACYKGVRENFTHCDKCNTCVKNMDLSYHQKQVCGQQKNQQDICTVCLSKFDNMLMKSVQLVCTHLVHQTCYIRLLRAGIKNCSVCQKQMKSRLEGAAEYQKFISIYAMTEVQQMKINTYHNILCNSCKKNFVAHWHSKGYFCPYCDSIDCVQQDIYEDSIQAQEEVKKQYAYMRQERNVIPIYPLILWPKDKHEEMIDMIQDYVEKYKDFWITCRKKMVTCPYEMPLHELVNAFCLVRDIDEYLGFAALNLCHARKIFPKAEEDGRPSKLDEIVCSLIREIRSSRNQEYE